MLLAGCGSVMKLTELPPDQGLFERAMDSMQDQRFGEAATLLETLECTYPESRYAARTKSMLDDMWYARGGVSPRPETKDGESVTFFPPLQEAQ